jgi:hypothetical protein
MATLKLGKKYCSSCFLKISMDQKSINYLTCGGWFHARTAFLKSPVTCQQTEIDICNMYLSCSLPFHSIDDLEFHFIFGDFSRVPSDEIMDRLTQLKFNPFHINNNNIANAQHFENYMPENLDDLTCNYYLGLPNDFAMTNSNITDNKNLSILNLNIRSIANKFDSFRNLLSTLK